MDERSAGELLAHARSVITAAVVPGPPIEPPPQIPEMPHGGAFVTLKRHGRLRGCMGTFSPRETVVRTVETAARSAVGDPRFQHCPITADELRDLRIEISVLSRPEPTRDPASLEVGRHGVWIRRGAASGCFLPQVATERNWSAEEFLSNCCSMKAGLAPDAWRDRDTEVLLFTAEILAETG